MQNNKIHFSSDSHFGHRNIIKYCPESRGHFKGPNALDDMNDALIENWNAVVNQEDTIYHLGDFAFLSQAAIKDILYRLNGNIIFVIGNHDKALSKQVFQNELKSRWLVEEFHPGYHEVKINNTKFVLNHYAQRVWNQSHYGAIHLYGHSHGSLPGFGKSVDVGVDSQELAAFTGGVLRPWSLTEIENYMSTREIGVIDHHDSDDPR